MKMRNPKWHRDEVILVLDLYYDLESGQMNSNNPEVIKLSELLNRLPIHVNRPDQAKFRNANGINLKLGNFKHFDPDYPGKGLKGGSKLDKAVLDEFYGKRELLKSIANKIKSTVENTSLVEKLYSIPNEKSFAKNRFHKIMTIDEIYKKGNLSIRSYHVCKYNNIDTIYDLRKYFLKNKSFLKFRNCGRKSDEELIKLCKDYYLESIDNNTRNLILENLFKKLVAELTRTQREVISSFIFVNTNSLSVRSKNAIKLYLNGNLKTKSFVEKILLADNFNVKNIKNIGAKCVPEIEVYISIIKNFILEVSQTIDEKYLSALKNKYLIQRTFDITSVPDEILESESIFKLTEFLLNQNAFFDETQTSILKKALKLFNNQKECKLDEIAKQVDLSRERVRQIRKLCLKDLFNKLLFISNFNDDLFQNYSIETDSNYVEITTDILDKINQSNNTNFSREFITYILSVYLKDNFLLVGNHEDVLLPKFMTSRNRHNWNNLYLIDNKLALEFDFTSFTNDISNRVSDRIEESYSFNFKSYLSKFLTNNNIDFLDFLFPICEKIINEEFEIYLDLEESINFKRNTTRQVHEYAFEALEHLGKPSKVKEIFEKVIELHPGYNTEAAKIRISMKRKNGFVPIGRKSVFGLKKWEKELENFKGGTIKEIITQFLEKFNTPIHISAILKEVNTFRTKTNERNIITNLKLDPNNSFIIFNQNFIGLTSKKNNYDLEKYSNLPIQLGKYIIGKFKSGYSLNEIKHHCSEIWGLTLHESELIIQNLKYFKQNKTHNFSSFEKKILPKIEYQLDKGYISKYSLKGLINFILEKQRMPNSRDVVEKNLYQYYYRIKKELENKTSLNPEQLQLKNLIVKYGQSNPSSKYNLKDLINFISEKQRMPDSRNPDERKLYYFYYRIKTSYKKNKLSSKLRTEFIKLTNIINDINNEN